MKNIEDIKKTPGLYIKKRDKMDLEVQYFQ